MMGDPEEDKLAFERLKVEIDVVKHLSTLNTGAILLIATFLEKIVHKQIISPELLVGSFSCFVGSLFTCVFYLWTPWSEKDLSPITEMENNVWFALGGLAFIAGIICFVIFSYRNL